MKRFFTGFLVFLFLVGGSAWAEEIRSPIYYVDLDIASGATTGRALSATTEAYSSVSWFTFDGRSTVLDMSEYKTNLGVFSFGLEPKPVWALSNESGEAYDGVNTSAATMTFVYTCANINHGDVWANSGLTTIFVPTISGQSVCGQVFTPNFMRYYMLGVIPTGVSNMDSTKIEGVLLLQ